jgi:hypothetical protein
MNKRTQERNKYNAQRTEFDGHKFDSKVEMERYLELRYSKLPRGEVSDLKVHPKFELQPAFKDKEGKRHRAITYTADFSYLNKGGNRIVEDVKGGKATQTQLFRVKAKMLCYKHPDILFRIVQR